MADDSPQLAVLMYDERCGTLTPAPSLTYEFSYTEEWIGADRPSVSLSLPVGAPAEPRHVRAYFGGLLPEGPARRQLAEREGVDPLDDMELLRLLGRECPGALTIVPLADDGSFDGNRGPKSTQWLSDDDLEQLVESLRVSGTDDPVDTYSVSLAGAQLKRGVLLDQVTGRVGISQGDELSSHILKLEPERYPGMAANEHCMQCLAADLQLRASRTHVRKVGDERVLLVQRYDREAQADAGHPVRLHQEDMCQALGFLAVNKYEKLVDGTTSGPTVLDIVELLRSRVRPAVQAVDDFLRLFWFNTIVGNVDAHSKNYSILYSRNMRALAVAPLYDAICVTAFHADKSREQRLEQEPLVMNIGGQTRFWQLTNGDLADFASALSIAPKFVARQVVKIAVEIDAAVGARIAVHQADDLTADPILDMVHDEIRARCEFIAGTAS